MWLVCRAKIFEDIDRMISPESLVNQVVYDFDEIVKEMGANYNDSNSVYSNDDAMR